MKNVKSIRVLVILLLMSTSASILVFPQTYKNKSTIKATQIINKLSQDVTLTEKQKAVIKVKMDSLAVNVQKEGQSSTTASDLTYNKGIKRIYQEVQDSILTPQQMKTLKARQELRKKAIVEQFKNK